MKTYLTSLVSPTPPPKRPMLLLAHQLGLVGAGRRDLIGATILLRWVELQGEMRRGIAVLKVRGSGHEKQIREFTSDHKGMHIRDQFAGVNEILTGLPTSIHGFEQQRLSTVFEPPNS